MCLMVKDSPIWKMVIIFQNKYQEKRNLKEKQVDLVLHAMDHGMILGIKEYQRGVLEFGVKFAKKCCVTPCFDIFHMKENYKEILLNMRYPVQGGNDNE